MIALVVDIKRAAQVAATKSAMDSAEFWNDTPALTRKRALSYLEQAGFPPFLMNNEGVIPLCQGSSWADHRESKVDWVLHSRKEVEAYIKFFELDLFEDDPLDKYSNLSPFYASYNGPGRWFREGPDIKIGRNHILITSFAAMDI